MKKRTRGRPKQKVTKEVQRSVRMTKADFAHIKRKYESVQKFFDKMIEKAK